MKRFCYKNSPANLKWEKKTLRLEAECYKETIELKKFIEKHKKNREIFAKILDIESFFSVKNSLIQDDQSTLEEKKYLLALSEVLHKKRISNQIFFLLHEKIKKEQMGPKQKPFQYRSHQNWIGKEGCSRKEAYFFPPKPSDVKKKMKELITYLNKQDSHKLIQLAIGFAQFLIIHPFMDGNGRIARAFIPFYLKQKKVIDQPVILLSWFFKKNRKDYYRLLFWITRNKSWEKWIQFFLLGILESIKNVRRYFAE